MEEELKCLRGLVYEKNKKGQTERQSGQLFPIIKEAIDILIKFEFDFKLTLIMLMINIV